MSRISSCAACHGDILIPGLAQPLDRMRCPLCGSDFLVQDVLATSILAPPEAILLESAAASAAASLGMRPSRGDALPEHTAESPAEAARPRRKQPSFLSHLFGVVGGGLIGLSLGYVALLKVFGPSYDFLEIADKLPAWVSTPIPALQNRFGGAQPAAPKNERGLGELLNTPDEAPRAEAPPHDLRGPGALEAPIEMSPPVFIEPAPPAQAMPQPTDPTLQDAPPHDPALHDAPPVSPSGDGENNSDNKPLTTQAGLPGPKQFTAYTGEDLASAVNDVSEAMRCLVCNGDGTTTRTVLTSPREVGGAKVQQTAERSMPCEACGGRAMAKMSPALFAKLSHLGEVATFVSRNDNAVWDQREALQNLLVTIGSDQQASEAIGRLAGFQLDNAHRKDGGIALAGTVQEMSRVGELYALRLVLFGLPKPVTVVSWRPAQPAIREHDRVLILGCVVNNPTDNLAGYEGPATQVVWGGLPVKLPPAP